MVLSLGGRKSVTFATFVVAMTLGLSMFPSNAGELVVEAEGMGDDFVGGVDCDSEEECGEIIMLEDFASPKHNWVEMNDPVMGGKSTGTFSVDDANNVGVFNGSVEIVSFLNAPGFIKAETTKGEEWPDASSCDGLRFTLKSSTPDYKGFRVSFGNKRPKGAFPYSYGFKTNLVLDGSTTDFQTVKLPFDQFTDKWDPGSGEAVVTCADNNEYCPQEEDKQNLFSIAVWGEGVEGKVDLEIQSVAAYGCSGETSSITIGGKNNILIEDFKNPTHEWRTMNDPVMGGQSTSSVSVEDGIAKFEGTCAIVPFLHAPGFITMTTGVHPRPGGHFDDSSESPTFPDVSGCQGLGLTLRSNVDYKGYYVSFGTDRAPGGHHATGYKTHLDLSASDDFVDLEIPFSDFSSSWDDGTGKTKVTCQEDSQFCPSLDNLRDMKTISFWGEGVEGTVALDVKSIGAYGCASGSTPYNVLITEVVYDTSPYNISPLLSTAFCSLVIGGLLFGRRFLRGKQRSTEYQEVVTNEVGLV